MNTAGATTLSTLIAPAAQADGHRLRHGYLFGLLGAVFASRRVARAAPTQGRQP